jgi:hypothetical protein
LSLGRAMIGYALPDFPVTISLEALVRFVSAIGEQRVPAESDLLPPTYLKLIAGVVDTSLRIVRALGIDLRRMLHAKQEFEYLAPVRAGATLTARRTIAEMFQKKGGVLDCVVIETSFRDASGTLVALSRQTLLVRNPRPEQCWAWRN